MTKIFGWFGALTSRYNSAVLGCAVYPLELLRRGSLRGPLITQTGSASNQWAGRTTINSGSASQVVSTTVVNSDSLISMGIEAAVAAAYSVSGRISIASGTSTGTASTTAVYSGDIVGLSWESPNAITSGMALRVDSIVNGVSFAVATSNSLTTIASGAVAMWSLFGKALGPVKVNTVAPGAYFTLGWADGNARPMNATVMWEIRRAS